MKIGSSDSPQPLATTTLSTSRATPAETPAAGAAGSAVQAGGAAPDSSTKVAQVSASIAEGSFKPNPEAIADKLISNAQELLNKVASP